MSYKQLTDEQKAELLTKLNWDYDVSTKDLRDLINGKKTSAGAFTTETFLWEDLVNLWGLLNCIKLYTEKTRRNCYEQMVFKSPLLIL